MVKKNVALILALVMLLALAACGDSSKGEDLNSNGNEAETVSPSPANNPDDGSSEKKTIRIGHLVDKTGVETLTGLEAERSLEFALQLMGNQIAGHPVEILVRDTRNNTDTALYMTRTLVNVDGVDVILGPTQIGQKIAVADYIASVGVPMIYYNGTPTEVFEGNDYIFSAGGSTAQMSTAMADYLYHDLGYRTINTITQDNTGGHDYMEPLIETFQALGGEVVSEQYTPVPTADYTYALMNLPDADALVAWVSGSDAIALWSAWYDLGVNEKMPMHAASHGGFTDYYICDMLAQDRPEVIEAMLKETYAPITYSCTLNSAENNEFVSAWSAKYGSMPEGTNLPGATYSALQLLACALEATDGDTDPAKLCQAIQAAEITSPEGHLYFSGEERTATKDVHIVKLVQLEDGTFNYEIQKTYSDVPVAGLSVG